MFNYLHYDKITGNITGQGCTPDDTIPSGCLPCTPEQAQNWQQYSIDVSTGTPSIVDAPASVLLAQAKTTKIAALTAARDAAMMAPVSFTTKAGTTAMFSTTSQTIGYLQSVIAAGSAAWTANLWLDNTGSVIAPFSFSDVQGLAAAIEAVETPEYHDLLVLIGNVISAKTITSVNSITW